MLILISPAKTLDMDTPVDPTGVTQPDLLDRSEVLVKKLRRMSASKLGALMNVSDAIAGENARRYKAWSRPFTTDNAKPAVFAFRGDVYQGLDADTLDRPSIEWAQAHLRILSGLYGVLRPLDLMQAYRLEMGTTLGVERKKDLYGFWGTDITDALNTQLAKIGSDVVVNLASQEYFRSVDPKRLDAEVITPAFKENRDGVLKMISFSAKKARGLMTRYIVENRVTDAAGLQGFDVERYRYRKTGSTAAAPLFVRKGLVKKA